jgi:Ni/Fe-hydrogenase subunit HybB-like protein
MKAARVYRLIAPLQGRMGLLLALMAAGGGAGLLVFIRGLYVTKCVGLYFSVLLMETLPILGDAPWMRSVYRLAPVLALAGLGLSMLHQSSLGATYGVLKARPIWFKPGLPVVFMISAVAGGISMTLLASMLAARLTPRARLNEQLVEKLTRFVGWTLLLYLYLRFWDVFAQIYANLPGRTEGLRMLTQGALAFDF